MPNIDNYAAKCALAVLALGLALAPFVHSAWNYQRAAMLNNLPEQLRKRRKDAAFEWRGWKIFCTAAALIVNTIINFIP
jgi:hypothetical protein